MSSAAQLLDGTGQLRRRSLPAVDGRPAADSAHDGGLFLPCEALLAAGGLLVVTFLFTRAACGAPRASEDLLRRSNRSNRSNLDRSNRSNR